MGLYGLPRGPGSCIGHVYPWVRLPWGIHAAIGEDSEVPGTRGPGSTNGLRLDEICFELFILDHIHKRLWGRGKFRPCKYIYMGISYSSSCRKMGNYKLTTNDRVYYFFK